MKEFLFLFRSTREEMSKLSEVQTKEYINKWDAWFKKLTEDGRHDNVGDRLTHEARTLMGTGKVITDGPYPESKEIIGGFAKVKAEDMDDATKIAATCPIFDVNGSLEIRVSHYSH